MGHNGSNGVLTMAVLKGVNFNTTGIAVPEKLPGQKGVTKKMKKKSMHVLAKHAFWRF